MSASSANGTATCHLGQVLAPADGGIEIGGATATISVDDLQAGVNGVGFGSGFLDLTARQISSTAGRTVYFNAGFGGICRIRGARLVNSADVAGPVTVNYGGYPASRLELVNCHLVYLLDLVLPGIGSLLALVLGGAYHGYQQLRNRKANEALVQGIETARAVLETTPQGQAADALVVKWLMENQKAAGVFATVSTLVDRAIDNPAARIAVQEIAERVLRAEQALAVAVVPSAASSSPAAPTAKN